MNQIELYNKGYLDGSKQEIIAIYPMIEKIYDMLIANEFYCPLDLIVEIETFLKVNKHLTNISN